MFTRPLFKSTFENIFSAEFGGVDERIELLDIPGLESENIMSIGFWVKSIALSGTFRTMFGGGLSTSANPRLQMLVSSANKYSFFIRDNAGLDSTIVEGNLEDNTWHFLVLVRNGSNWELFDNAVSVATKTFAPGAFSLDDFNIGALASNSILAGFFIGKIDEVSIWNTNLSSADISRLYNDGIPIDLLKDPTFPDLVHLWRFTQIDINNFPVIEDHVGSIDGVAVNMEVGDIQGDTPP